jgi:hypothetical protein
MPACTNVAAAQLPQMSSPLSRSAGLVPERARIKRTLRSQSLGFGQGVRVKSQSRRCRAEVGMYEPARLGGEA